LVATSFAGAACAGERELKDALELFYVKKGAMGTVACDTKKEGSNTYVYCYPARLSSADATGGLYALRENPPGIIPLNGKAQTHTQKLSNIETVNGSRIPLVEAPQELRLKVSTIRDMFR